MYGAPHSAIRLYFPDGLGKQFSISRTAIDTAQAPFACNGSLDTGIAKIEQQSHTDRKNTKK